MTQENIGQIYRSKYADEVRNCFNEEINQNELMSRKHKKVCTSLIFIDHSPNLTSAFTGCVSIFAFASLVCISIGMTSSAVGLKICAITAGLKWYESIINKNKRTMRK